MRKEIVAQEPHATDPGAGPWMNLAAHGRIRLTSEDPKHPIEAALESTPGGGWRAASSGPQTIWIDFDVPQMIREIDIRFEVPEQRTQEFVLVGSTDCGRSYREIVRQQFNFSPGTTIENERYFPQLDGVTDLKLVIVPDISGGDARASVRSLRVR